MNKDLMRKAGFGKEVDDVEAGNCPLCKKVIHPNSEFRDELSLREYRISGMCQECQDGVFSE